MKRKRHKDSKPREHKKGYGKDIAQRPEIAALRIEEGHWEGDTVVGKKGWKGGRCPLPVGEENGKLHRPPYSRQGR